MEAYGALAQAYDRLTRDVSYPEFLAFYQSLMALYGERPQTVLDLACGTGSLSVLLAQSGCRVLGADSSEQMLTQAYEKALALETNRPFFIRQKMQSLRLPEPVDCVICCLDSLDYLTNPEDCRKTLLRVQKCLRPGGLFLFDVNTPEKLRAMDGQLFIDEDEDVYCVWRGFFDNETNICTYGMDIFRREGSVWRRSAEEHREYAYSQQQLCGYLREAGFTDIRVFGDRRLNAPEADEQRLFFAARKEAYG